MKHPKGEWEEHDNPDGGRAAYPFPRAVQASWHRSTVTRSLKSQLLGCSMQQRANTCWGKCSVHKPLPSHWLFSMSSALWFGLNTFFWSVCLWVNPGITGPAWRLAVFAVCRDWGSSMWPIAANLFYCIKYHSIFCLFHSTVLSFWGKRDKVQTGTQSEQQNLPGGWNLPLQWWAHHASSAAISILAKLVCCLGSGQAAISSAYVCASGAM